MYNNKFDTSQPDPLMANLQSAQGTGKFFWFASTDDIEKALTTINHWNNGPWRVYSEEKMSFGYTKDMPQALQYLKYGWPDAIDGIDLTDVALSIPREIQSEFERTSATQGAQIDVARYLEGMPECMYDFMPNIVRKKTVRLFMNMSADCAGGSKKLIERGKTIASCIDWLERSGYRVRLDVGDCFSGYGVKNDNGWCIAFCAKDYDQSFDVERVTFITGSPAMLGRIFFGIESTSKAMQSQFHSTYGGVAPVPKFIRDEYDYIIEYGAPFNKDVAATIIEQIVTGNKPKQPPIIDEGEFAWRDFEHYEAPPPTDMDIPIFRPKQVMSYMEEINKKIADMTAQSEGGGGGEQGGAGGEPLMLYQPPTAHIKGHWYIVKDGPKTRALAAEHKKKYEK